MRVVVDQGFVTQEECAVLNEWALRGIEDGYLEPAPRVSTDGNVLGRFSSRRTAYKTPPYPAVTKAILERIRKRHSLFKAPPAHGHGNAGIVVTATMPGGDIPVHHDPFIVMGMHTLRCNVVTQAPEAGGLLHVAGMPVPVEAGDLHCYLVTKHEHYVTRVQGNRPRILWMFGFGMTSEGWGE